MPQSFEQIAAATRLRILRAILAAGKGHIGGALSCTDILVALYDGGILRVRPEASRDPDRDRFIMSKGHPGVALYAVLARQGFFPDAELDTMCRDGAMLGEHPNHLRNDLTGFLHHNCVTHTDVFSLDLVEIV